MSGLPRSLRPFLGLVQALRAEGFAVAPEQGQAFIAAVGLLGPRSLGDVRRAARATLAPPPERGEEFDRIFDAVFLGRAFAAPAPGTEDDLPAAHDATPGLLPEPEAGEEPSGADASAAERLFARAFGAGEPAGLAAFRRALPAALPRRRSRRWLAGRGPRIDARRALRQMVRRDGELLRLPRQARRQRPRRVLLLVDVSGSMKASTEGALRLAHALVHGGDRVEVCTLGTRLTRVTRALRQRDVDRALAQAAGLVADWDGGTRLGEALAVFLSVPRFAAFARGALTVVVSDGLEQGGPEALVAAMVRLRRLTWRILWLTPLAADPTFRPETAALRAVLPMIDQLGDGSGPQAAASEILRVGRRVQRPPMRAAIAARAG